MMSLSFEGERGWNLISIFDTNEYKLDALTLFSVENENFNRFKWSALHCFNVLFPRLANKWVYTEYGQVLTISFLHRRFLSGFAEEVALDNTRRDVGQDFRWSLRSPGSLARVITILLTKRNLMVIKVPQACHYKSQVSLSCLKEKLMKNHLTGSEQLALLNHIKQSLSSG